MPRGALGGVIATIRADVIPSERRRRAVIRVGRPPWQPARHGAVAMQWFVEPCSEPPGDDGGRAGTAHFPGQGTEVGW